MTLLTDNGVRFAYHYTPLHYLPFITAEKALLSKLKLRRLAFSEFHFRSTSKRADEERGFGEYVHLTLSEKPPILAAKLSAGFPHVEIAVPASAMERARFHLCRFNIAKSRYLRRDGSKGYPEGPGTGRYYQNKQIPMAQTDAECRALFEANYGKNMIEVLVFGRLALPDDCVVTFFHADDHETGLEIIRTRGVPWRTELSDRIYRPNDKYAWRVRDFIRKAMTDPAWKGDGLEFDQV